MGKTHESRNVKFEEGAGELERVIVEVDLGDDEEATGKGGVEMKEEDVPTSEGQTGEELSLSNPEAPSDEPGSMEEENDSGGGGNGKDNNNNAYIPANVNRPSSPESEPPEPAQPCHSTRATQAPVPDDDTRYTITSYPSRRKKKPRETAAIGTDHMFLTRDPEYEAKMSSAEASLWQTAMNEEMETQKAMETYKEVVLPHGAHIIPCRWVYQEKRDSDGNIARYKARLVTKGFRECEGIDYEETYAPTPSKASILTLITIAVAMDWEIAQFDVKAAFLYGELDEELYLHPPAGYPTTIEGGVWRMKKSIYGLKQAAACWYQKLLEELAKGQFYSTKDPSVFCSASKDTVLASHIDNIICIARTKAACKRAWIMLEKPFNIHDLGNLDFYLGMRFICNRACRTMIVSQEQYFLDILGQFGMADVRPFSLPL
jgi:hypothetical protein